MSWIFGSCTGPSTAWLQLSDALVAAATGNSVATVGISSGGTGYTVGDILSVVGGTGTVTAQVEVTSVAAGVIDGVRLYNAGVYTVNPSSPNSVTGGTGSSASLTLTFAANGWTAERNTTYSGSEKEVILNGNGDGADEIFVGWRTFSNVSSNYYNLELHGLTGYTAGLDMVDQPGVSPGFFNASGDAQDGCYLLAVNTSLDYWININSYRIILIIKVGSAYFNAYLGWGNRFATETEFPYPLVVAGHTSNALASYSQSQFSSGLTDPWVSGSDTFGPMAVLMPNGTWYHVANATVSGTTATRKTDRVVMPAARTTGQTHTGVLTADKFIANTLSFEDIIYFTGTPLASIRKTPGTTDALLLLPTAVIFNYPDSQVVVELSDVYWVSSAGGILSNDRAIVNGVAHRVFQNCNRSEIYSFLAVREN